MSDGNLVTIQMTTQEADAIRGILKVVGGFKGIGSAAADAGKSVQKAGSDAGSSFEGTLKTLSQVGMAATGAGAAFGGVMHTLKKAAELLRAEWDEVLSRMKEALGTQVDVAGSQKRMFEALGPKADISRGELAGLVQSKSSISLGEQHNAITAALRKANAAGFSQKLAAETGIESGKLAKSATDEERQALASGAVELQIANKELTPAQSVAQMRRFQRMSESSGLAINEKLAKGVGHVMENAPGTTEGQAAGFILGIQKHANLADTGDAASVAEKIVVGMRDANLNGNLTEMLGHLPTNKKAQAAVSKRTRRNVEAFATIQDLFKSGSDTSKTIEQLQAEAGASPAAVLAEETSFNKAISREPGQLAAGIKKESGKARERALWSETEDAIKQAAMETVADAVKVAKLPVIAQEFHSVAGQSLAKGGYQGIYSAGIPIPLGRPSTAEEQLVASASVVGNVAAAAPGRGVSDEVVRELIRMKESLEARLDALREQRDKPQKVEITGDKRPDVPRSSASSQLGESHGASGSW